MLEIKLTQDRFDELCGQLRDAVSDIVRATAFDVQDEAQNRAPVDTGALKNSIYTVTDRGSSYSDAASSAASARPAAEILPEVTASDAGVGDFVAVVAPSVEYAIYVEMGTSKQAAQPYLGPAAESMRTAFERAMQKVLK